MIGVNPGECLALDRRGRDSNRLRRFLEPGFPAKEGRT